MLQAAVADWCVVAGVRSVCVGVCVCVCVWCGEVVVEAAGEVGEWCLRARVLCVVRGWVRVRVVWVVRPWWRTPARLMVMEASVVQPARQAAAGAGLWTEEILKMEK